MSKALFCFGLGYSAKVLATRAVANGWRARGTVREREKAEALKAEGFEASVFSEESSPENLADLLQGATHLLSSVPPGENGDPILATAHEALVNCDSLEWVGYLSTTGVYGTRDGGLVDEESELRPTSPRSLRRMAAEVEWLSLYERYGLPVHIFRLAGIYGPGRNPLKNLRSGKAQRILRPGQVFSRIHVEDIARVLEASFAKPSPGRIYNVCDNAPEEPARVLEYASTLLGQDPPDAIPFEEAELSPMARTFWLDNKRVSNQRLLEELDVELKYPDYQSGLKALFEAGE